MRRILLLLAGAAILALPAAAAATPQAQGPKPGFLVVRSALTDGDPFTGRPVATVAVTGFVIGHVAQEGAVEIFHYSGTGAAAQVSGVDVSRDRVFYNGQRGTKFSGSDFRFRAVGGTWRVVAYGAGVSLYAGGVGQASLHGSVFAPRSDGRYSFNGKPFTSMPSGVATGKIGTK
jgi:hypothetical protein